MRLMMDSSTQHQNPTFNLIIINFMYLFTSHAENILSSTKAADLAVHCKIQPAPAYHCIT